MRAYERVRSQTRTTKTNKCASNRQPPVPQVFEGQESFESFIKYDRLAKHREPWENICRASTTPPFSPPPPTPFGSSELTTQTRTAFTFLYRRRAMRQEPFRAIHMTAVRK